MGNFNLQNYPALIDKGVLQNLLKGYKRVNDKISYMIEKGELIPLVRGKYISGEAYRNGKVSLYPIANALYGPSYISAYTAMAFHQMIPEKVVNIESVTVLRSKTFKTAIGRFQYYKTPEASFYIGIDHMQQGASTLLIASPTKALIDALWIDQPKGISGVKTMREHLIENMRIDEEIISELDLNIIADCIAYGRKKRMLGYLYKIVETYNH